MFKKLALILLAAATLLLVAPASAWATPVTWGPGVWGSNPFDTSQASAVARVEEAIRPMNVPEEVKRRWVEAVRENPQGTPYSIRPGECFPEMQTGSGLERRGVCVPWNVTLVPSATSWTVDVGGTRYTLVLPDICHNWAWTSRPVPQEIPVEEPCAIVTLTVPEGRGQLSFVGLSSVAPPPSRCYAVRHGDGEWEALPGGCIDCIDWDPVLARMPESAAADRNISMESRIVIRATTVQIRVPVWFEAHHLGFYLLREDGQCSWLIVEPSDWTAHRFSFSEWRWRPQGS